MTTKMKPAAKPARVPDEYIECIPTVNALLYQFAGRRLTAAVAPPGTDIIAAFDHSGDLVFLAPKVLRAFTKALDKVKFDIEVAPEIGLLVHECGHARFSPREKEDLQHGVSRLMKGHSAMKRSSDPEDALMKATTLLEEPTIEFLSVRRRSSIRRRGTPNMAMPFLVAGIAKYFIEDGIDTEDTVRGQAFHLAVLLGGRYMAYESGVVDHVIPPILATWGEKAFDLLDPEDAMILRNFFYGYWRSDYIMNRRANNPVKKYYENRNEFAERIFGHFGHADRDRMKAFYALALDYMETEDGPGGEPGEPGDEPGDDEDGDPTPAPSDDPREGKPTRSAPTEDGEEGDPKKTSAGKSETDREEKVEKLLEDILGDQEHKDRDDLPEEVKDLEEAVKEMVTKSAESARRRLAFLRSNIKTQDWDH